MQAFLVFQEQEKMGNKGCRELLGSNCNPSQGTTTLSLLVCHIGIHSFQTTISPIHHPLLYYIYSQTISTYLNHYFSSHTSFSKVHIIMKMERQFKSRRSVSSVEGVSGALRRQKSRLYIISRCVIMLLCWHD